MVRIPGATFLMGSDDHYPEEAPAHKVTVGGFWMDAGPVTNREFGRFVRKTGYVTVAERAPDPAEYPGARPELLVPFSSVFVAPPHRVSLADPYHWWKPVQGADLSVYSMTKYIGGHSDLVAGAVVGEKGLVNQIRMMRNTIGTICDPNTAWMLLRSLETLELRMERAGENAAKVCDFLRSHPKVETVGYLGFLEEGSRQADIYRRHNSEIAP